MTGLIVPTLFVSFNFCDGDCPVPPGQDKKREGAVVGLVVSSSYNDAPDL